MRLWIVLLMCLLGGCSSQGSTENVVALKGEVVVVVSRQAPDNMYAIDFILKPQTERDFAELLTLTGNTIRSLRLYHEAPAIFSQYANKTVMVTGRLTENQHSNTRTQYQLMVEGIQLAPLQKD